MSKKIIISLSPLAEAEDIVINIQNSSTQAESYQVSRSASFSGPGFMEIMIVLGTSGTIAALAKILIAWLEAKQKRVVKINGKEIQGYSIRRGQAAFIN